MQLTSNRVTNDTARSSKWFRCSSAAHSFKYAAALQAAHLGPRPQLIRIETRAGHGSGKPTDKAIEEGADILAFLAKWTGLKVGD